MRRTAPFIFVALLLPMAAFALNFTDSSLRYTDAPFTTADTAGISVLTNLGAVSGNPDGTFAPNKTVNRAEFLKILFLSNPKIIVSSSDAANCFPDVQVTDWFSSYVCLAQKRGTVGGYPDGTFKPEQTVNYAEAIKMLGEAYGLTPAAPTDPWYQGYADMGLASGVLLPDVIPYETPLTRGQVARLVAAYRANNDGELTHYREFENGEAISLSSSSSSASSVSSGMSSASNTSSSLSSSSSSSSSSTGLFPAQSHFLLLGKQTPVLADGVFLSQTEDAAIRIVNFAVKAQVLSIDHLLLVDGSGTQIASLKLSTNENTGNLKWEADVASGSYILKRGVPTTLGIEAVMKASGSGGSSNELFQSDTLSFDIVAQGASGTSYQLAPSQTHYPMHQTAAAHITAVRNADTGSTTMQQGSNELIGMFAISGKTMTGGTLNLDSIEFQLQTRDVNVTHIRIGGASAIQQADCGVDTVQTGHITCATIPAAFQTIGNGTLVISVYADVATDARTPSGGSLQLTFAGPGQIGQAGAIHWDDNVGHYNWIESTVPLENGPAFTITP